VGEGCSGRTSLNFERTEKVEADPRGVLDTLCGKSSSPKQTPPSTRTEAHQVDHSSSFLRQVMITG